MKKSLPLMAFILISFISFGQHTDTNSFDDNKIQVSPVGNIKKENEKDATFIKNRLEKLIGPSLRNILENRGIAYPPKYILMRVFKVEKALEIWAGNSNTDSLKLACTFKICAFDDLPGPKLNEGDGKTPEGFYNCTLDYSGGSWFMWIKLNPNEIDESGIVNKGSSFRIFVDYPNNVDYGRTKKFAGNKSPGSAIFMHGNCVSIGCLSFRNKTYLPIFLLSSFHLSALYGPIQLHVFPFKMTNKEIESYSSSNPVFDQTYLKEFWKNLQEGYQRFNKTPVPFSIKYLQNKYIFESKILK